MANRSFVTLVAVVVLAGWVCPVTFGQGLTVRRQAPGTGNQTSNQSGTTTANDFSGAGVAAYTSLTGTGNGVNTGTYTAAANGFGIFNDQYGAGSTYLSTGGRSSPTSTTTALNTTATLTLSTTTYYMGIFWMAIDGNNRLDFYNGSTLVGSVTAAQLLADAGTFLDPGIGATGLGTNRYNGTGGNNTGNNTGEKAAYINIYSDDSASGFDRVVFSNTGGSGFESDNHTFATSLIASGSQTGTLVPVPEPAGLLATAGGLLAAGRRLRRRVC